MIFIEILTAVAALLFLWWLVQMLTRPRAEPRDQSDVLAPVGKGPRSNAGAVALEEPDDEQGPDLIGRK